eukprot:1158542-Pelagomonas_calceolata.AAC.6
MASFMYGFSDGGLNLKQGGLLSESLSIEIADGAGGILIYNPDDSLPSHETGCGLISFISFQSNNQGGLKSSSSPTCIVLSEEELLAISDICAGAKAWLVLDET